jgi:hypothetical protein
MNAPPSNSDVRRDHEHAAEPSRLQCRLYALNWRVEPVLLHDEQPPVRLVEGRHHGLPVAPARRHRLLRDDVEPRLRCLDGLPRMQAARRRQHHEVEFTPGQQVAVRLEAAHLLPLHERIECRSVNVAQRDELDVGGVVLVRLEMLSGNAPASNQGDAQSAQGSLGAMEWRPRDYRQASLAQPCAARRTVRQVKTTSLRE